MAELVSTTYAMALFEVSVDEKKVDQYLDEVNFVKSVLNENKKFFELLKTPKINTNEKKKILSNVFQDKLCKEVMNFLNILVDKRRIEHIIEIANEFEKRVYDYKGIVKAKAFSSIELTSNQIKNLELKLENKTGKNVEIENIIDSSLLGGVKIKFNDVVIDGTVKGRLNELENYLNRIIV
ncbi:F0F1 ATP synthase subunit delta [Sedimentibacter sp. zth1]|uniref:F0F1 ATP synthase subunit delta n=1 Tax=Sedimentibacter sp. zth1 TaxID=2816908 RepID=UPI001A916E76|nr:F0F1 ATP synthase subunit delta [Sedimentibacter sp. zth1]QSX05045.1 F0F1 ATP synthase subunit delta [Sedimentibacter sp. zth1]